MPVDERSVVAHVNIGDAAGGLGPGLVLDVGHQARPCLLRGHAGDALDLHGLLADEPVENLKKTPAWSAETKGYDDYRRMLDEVKPELVAIGPRWIDQHRDMVLAAVHCGARGIYMEKPFCRTMAEADELVAAMERGFELIQILVTEGPAAAWEKITDRRDRARQIAYYRASLSLPR